MAKKKNTAPEQKPITLTDMRIQVAMMNNKADSYIAKQQQNMEQNLQKATEKKLKKQDATREIRAITAAKKYIEMAEQRKYVANTLLEKREMLEYEVKFMKEMSALMQDFSVATAHMNGAEEFAQDFLKMSALLAEENAKMDEVMATMDAALGATQDLGSFTQAEKDIDDIISKKILDMQTAPGGVNIDKAVQELKTEI
jgi:hypothetical protein